MIAPKIGRCTGLFIVHCMLVMPTLVFGQTKLRESAIGQVPADAAFFYGTVNLNQQWQELRNSRVVQRLEKVAYVQELIQQLTQQWKAGEGDLGQARQMLQNPNIQNLLKLGREMFGDEVFVYGRSDWVEATKGLIKFQRRMMEYGSENAEGYREFWEELTPQDVESLYVPTTIVGFRIEDDANTRMQLDALEGLLRFGLSGVPEAQPLLQKLARKDLSDGQVLSVALDLSMIPEDELSPDDQEVVERARELLGDRKLVIELGLKGQFLLLAISGNRGQIEQFGQAAEALAEHPTLQPLRAVPFAQLRSVSYASAQMRDLVWQASNEDQFQGLVMQLAQATFYEFDSEEDYETWYNALEQDARWLDEKIESLKPEFGPYFSWAQRIEGGLEWVTYNLGQHQELMNASPLHVLNHAGGQPLGLLAVKLQDQPAVREIIDFLLDKGPEHAMRYVRAVERNPQKRQEALKALELIPPAVRDIVDVFTDKICPALDANELLIALAADWRTSQLGPAMPPPSQPLPIPELSIACTVTDREGLLDGIDALFNAFDRLVEVLREIDANAVPPGYQIPRPKQTDVDGNVKLHYPQIDESVPLPGLSPQLSIGDDIAVLGYSERQVGEMLKKSRLINRPGWLEDNTPVAVVSFMDWAAMVARGKPWLEFGLSMSTGGDLTRPLPIPSAEYPIPTGNDVLQIWDCFTSLGKSAATTTVQEDGSWVTRAVWVEE